MVGNRPLKDAFIIGQLRKSGALVLGKTNLSEWANFRSTLSTSGWSSRGKQTLCPYVLDRNPSGSSAGTGAAVAANLCALGIGTETNGSIVSPSSINGLVGIKPTVGLWSRSGIIPISATQDTAGPMARTVRDASILLGALAGIDPEDPTTRESEGKFKTDYTPYLQLDGLKGKRIGIEKTHLFGNETIVNLFKKALDQLRAQGAEIIEVDINKALDSASSAEFTVLQYEFKDGLNKYLKAYPGPMKTLADVIAFNKAHREEAMPYFQQETLISSESMGDLKDKAYLDALKKTLSSRDILLKLMQDNSLDAFGGITNGLACYIDLVNGDYDTGYSLSTPAAISGFPHITVPMGRIKELPIGLSFFAGPYQEPTLLGMAYAYEQVSKNRAAPNFIPRIGF
jgi:amidase